MATSSQLAHCITEQNPNVVSLSHHYGFNALGAFAGREVHATDEAPPMARSHQPNLWMKFKLWCFRHFGSFQTSATQHVNALHQAFSTHFKDVVVTLVTWKGDWSCMAESLQTKWKEMEALHHQISRYQEIVGKETTSQEEATASRRLEFDDLINGRLQRIQQIRDPEKQAELDFFLLGVQSQQFKKQIAQGLAFDENTNEVQALVAWLQNIAKELMSSELPDLPNFDEEEVSSPKADMQQLALILHPTLARPLNEDSSEAIRLQLQNNQEFQWFAQWFEKVSHHLRQNITDQLRQLLPSPESQEEQQALLQQDKAQQEVQAEEKKRNEATTKELEALWQRLQKTDLGKLLRRSSFDENAWIQGHQERSPLLQRERLDTEDWASTPSDWKSLQYKDPREMEFAEELLPPYLRPQPKQLEAIRESSVQPHNKRVRSMPEGALAYLLRGLDSLADDIRGQALEVSKEYEISQGSQSSPEPRAAKKRGPLDKVKKPLSTQRHGTFPKMDRRAMAQAKAAKPSPLAGSRHQQVLTKNLAPTSGYEIKTGDPTQPLASNPPSARKRGRLSKARKPASVQKNGTFPKIDRRAMAQTKAANASNWANSLRR